MITQAQSSTLLVEVAKSIRIMLDETHLSHVRSTAFEYTDPDGYVMQVQVTVTANEDDFLPDDEVEKMSINE